jgi:heptosyltransferase-1
MRVVLVRLSALGDIVHTWPLAAALRDADPRIHLTWVVEEALRPLVHGHPAVDAVVTVRTKRWRRNPFSARARAEISVLKGRFRELEPDLTLDPQGVFKSACVTRWTKAPRRVGLALPWRRERLAGLAYTDVISGAPGRSHVTFTNLEFVRTVGEISPTSDSPNGSWLLERVRGRIPEGEWSNRYAVVLPGAGGAHKVLAEETLARLSRGLEQFGFDVVVAWGPGEESRARRVVEAAGQGTHLAPPTDLEELAALLGEAALVVGGDTGPVHLAASFGVPTLAFFLGSDWRRNGPLGRRTAVISGAESLPPGPSGTARTRPHRELSADEILEAARALLVE